MSAYLHIDKSIHDEEGSWLIEVDDEGYIVRELEFDKDDGVVSITRPGEFGFWNDSMIPRLSPTSDEFASFWRELRAVELTKEGFEARWAAASRVSGLETT